MIQIEEMSSCKADNVQKRTKKCGICGCSGWEAHKKHKKTHNLMCCDNKVHRIQHELVLQRGNMRFAAMVGPEKKGSV